MKKLTTHIMHSGFRVMILLFLAVVDPAGADSSIRIIGDGTTKRPDNFGEPTVAPPPSSLRVSSTIRIIGDKKESVKKMVPEQPVVIEAVEKEQKINTAAEKEKLSNESDEQALVQQLAALKVEEERKANVQAEQKKALAEAARQAEINKELLAAQKAEEALKIAKNIERERLAKVKAEEENAKQEAVRQSALKQEQEQLAKARRAILERPLPEIDIPVTQSARTKHSADLPEISIYSLDTGPNQTMGDSTKTGLTPDTIWDLYLSAKANDPVLGRTEARVTGSKADSDQLYSTLMPHLNSSVGVKQISQVLTNYTTNDSSYDFTAFNYNVTASMTLLHLPTIYSLAASAASLRVEEAGVAAARQNLILKFTDSYFALLKAQADKHISLGEIKRLKQVLEQTQAFLKEGTGDIIAVYEAQSRLDGAGADLTKSESTLRLAEQRLSSVVGKPVTSIVNYLPIQPAGPNPNDVDWWVFTMEKEQPLVRQAREGIVQTAEQRKAVKAEYLPVLQASGGFDVNRGTAALPTAEVKQWFVGASISLPLYSGGETAAKVRRAVASEEERRHSFHEIMDQQRENVKQAYYNLRYNISLIRALEQKLTSAEIQLDAVKKGRNLGTRNAIDLLNAEQAYSIALRDYKYALYDNYIRIFQLKSAAGILIDTDISEVSKTAASPTMSSRLRYPTAMNTN